MSEEQYKKAISEYGKIPIVESNKILNLDFRSKYDYVKSLQIQFGLSDEESSSFLWILDM